MISGQDIILLVTYNLRERDTNAQFIINSANDAGIPLVVISSRDPYDIASLSNVKANIAIYGITGFDITNGQRNALETNIRSGLRTLFSGKNARPLNYPAGRLPADIKDPKVVLFYTLMAQGKPMISRIRNTSAGIFICQPDSNEQD